ncbi:uncharacterized protein LOC116168202 isoform X2 [Photinus pyralis]|uniref:uncharacterized protein LOC116168202 isoform X2 n=1 Tax=Photinus pyralis TaxID=7054 RepID=UPI00126773EA|nr:uncharacterized protein LOC116168202 isoform X2 [Photinus pyralis]
MLKKSSYDEFEYVVERIKPQRVCFGSAVQRDTNPIGRGISAFQKRFAYELNDKVTPQTYTYNHLTSGVARLANKVRSKKGVSGLCNGAERFPNKIFMRIPSPTRYTTEPFQKTFKQNFVPFNKKVGRKLTSLSRTPGPGHYCVTKKLCRRTKCDYNFGLPKIIPAVEVECTAKALHNCGRCGDICKDDYWHKNYTSFLCHICMEEEKVLREDFTMKQLKEFQKIRLCWYKHNHEGVDAYTQLYSDEKLKRRERCENYLNLYIDSINK